MKKTKPKKEKLNLVVGGLIAVLFMCGLVAMGIDAYNDQQAAKQEAEAMMEWDVQGVPWEWLEQNTIEIRSEDVK